MSGQVLASHPASQQLARLFHTPPDTPDFSSTGMIRRDYLKLIEDNVDFYKHHQTPEGAIIDVNANREWQYSTPAFALSAATLVAQKNRSDLLGPAVRAMAFATHALADQTTADGHADFYIPMLMHARRTLRPFVSSQTLAKWDDEFRRIIPETHYRDHNARGNWNIVNLSGELLRRKEKLVATTQKSAQTNYIERCLEKQQARMTHLGMYTDPNMPMAYDAFARCWLDDMLANDAYHGKQEAQLREFLLLGGLSSLLIISPTGEWACGGRSAHHQWNEAENIVIFEINADKWHLAGRDDIAGAMKRSAHLAFQSMLRWQRPSGEMWIVKNRAEPSTKFGYETYSSHSQYNLLPMAMLCIAFEWADDSIAERPAPCEVGGYVLDLLDKFHKVIANAGGMYVEIDTAADPHYNATGLQRIHKNGVPLSPLSDSAADSAFGPFDYHQRKLISPGIQWLNTSAANQPATQPARPEWLSLGEFINGFEPKPENPRYIARSADLDISDETKDRVCFTMRYHLSGEDSREIEETYDITPQQIEYSTRILGEPLPTKTRAIFPALVTDGANDLPVKAQGSRLIEEREGAVLTWEIVSPARTNLSLLGPRVPCHNGMMQAATADLPEGTREFKATITLSQK
jgi:hypothetical protein